MHFAEIFQKNVVITSDHGHPQGEKRAFPLLRLKLSTKIQGRNQLFISEGGNFYEISFDDVIVLVQPWYNFFENGHI